MRLSLYNENMKRIAIIGERFVSVLWSEGYNEIQTFTLELQETEEFKKKVRPDCFVGRDDRKTLMVIKAVHVKNGKVVAYGKQAARCLDDVPFVGTIEKDTQVAAGIRSAYEQGEGYRGISFADSDLQDLYGHQISNKSILELCETMCPDADMGFRAVRHGKEIRIEFYKPEEKPNLKYSQMLGNVTVDSVMLSTENLKNHVIVLGDGEGEERTRVEIDNSDGGQKLSLIVDARDIIREESDTDESYQEKLTARGNEYLLERTKTWECLFTPLTADFGNRFDLGDILTVMLPDFDMKFRTRVTRFTQVEQDNLTKTTIEVGNITIVR
ncbi:MAG: hypothetical protein IKB09_09760 [Oscillospiraceae bacterium]|nr:hypothetical protein [Oscillospiraceae bacterium]MBR6595158.1 hypothetical protein [Oscillospiraceae bacterium]